MAELRSYDLLLPAGERLDLFLARALAERGENISRSAIQRQIANGLVEGISPQQLKPGFRSKRPVAIRFFVPVAQETKLVPFAAKIPILYEDEYLAVVHKPAGMTVHPGAGTGNDTLVHALIGKLDRLAPHDERPGIIHRLDRETEGLMVIAKTEEARQRLSAAFAARQVTKIYTALVWGSVHLPEAVEGFIWRDLRNRKRMQFALKVPDSIARARSASLFVTYQTRYRYATELSLQLITGRTHQIRATLRYFHAPIIGDTLYGDDAGKCRLYKIGKERREGLQHAGMLLVACALRFQHPFKRRLLDFSIDLPERFRKVREALS